MNLFETLLDIETEILNESASNRDLRMRILDFFQYLEPLLNYKIFNEFLNMVKADAVNRGIDFQQVQKRIDNRFVLALKEGINDLKQAINAAKVFNTPLPYSMMEEIRDREKRSFILLREKLDTTVSQFKLAKRKIEQKLSEFYGYWNYFEQKIPAYTEEELPSKYAFFLVKCYRDFYQILYSITEVDALADVFHAIKTIYKSVKDVKKTPISSEFDSQLVTFTVHDNYRSMRTHYETTNLCVWSSKMIFQQYINSRNAIIVSIHFKREQQTNKDFVLVLSKNQYIIAHPRFNEFNIFEDTEISNAFIRAFLRLNKTDLTGILRLLIKYPQKGGFYLFIKDIRDIGAPKRESPKLSFKSRVKQ